MPDNPKDIIREAADALLDTLALAFDKLAKGEQCDPESAVRLRGGCRAHAKRLRTLLDGVWLDRETAERIKDWMIDPSAVDIEEFKEEHGRYEDVIIAHHGDPSNTQVGAVVELEGVGTVRILEEVTRKEYLDRCAAIPSERRPATESNLRYLRVRSD